MVRATRGKRAHYPWAGELRNIKDLLADPNVVGFVDRGQSMAYGSRVKAATRMLRDGEPTSEAVDAYWRRMVPARGKGAGKGHRAGEGCKARSHRAGKTHRASG